MANVILCADDFALTEGVSDGIARLARDRRLSATSALVTTRHWMSGHGSRMSDLRSDVAIGLHFNLTLGNPLGAMPWLCPTGAFPAVAAVVRASVARHIEADEVAAEFARQLDAFEQATGHAPDFIDGHQHVHALPIVRGAVLGVLKERYAGTPLLIRDPADTALGIIGRGGAIKKGLMLATLAHGFGDAVRASGFMTNTSFAGVSAFDRAKPYRAELDRFFIHAGACHLIMCHPGIVDDELPTLDPVVGRRKDELEALMSYPDLPAKIWHPNRARDGRVSWPGGVPFHG